MKIAVIGGGWVGCHLALKLIDEHEIHIYEKNENLFTETSYKNQNRLHLGYHYPRSFKTRELCLNTFNRFLQDYPFLIKDVPNNWYCIETNKSILDHGTFSKIFQDQDHYNIPNIFENIEGVVNTKEKQIDFEMAYKFFNDKLSKIHIKKTLTKKEILSLSKKYDLVIVCTNNHLSYSYNKNSFFEITVSYLYEKIKPTPFDALTIIDGPFFSIYPYKDNLYTITDVEKTPIKKFKNPFHIEKFKQKLEKNNVLNLNRIEIEEKIKKYYLKFSEHFQYKDYYLSTKAKIISSSDNRYPVITKRNNIYHCFTGKIQGVFIIEDYIKNEIINR